MPDAVRTGQVARGHARFPEGPGRPQRIGAGVDVDVPLDAEQRAVAAGRQREVVIVVARVYRRHEVLASILDPPHRMADFQRDRGDRDVFRHQAIFSAESAADIGSDDAHLVFGQTQNAREAEPLHLSALRGQIDDELVHPLVPIGQYAPAFERDRRLPVHAKLSS